MAPISIPMLERIIDLRQPSFYLSIASILFNPTFWNIVARKEHHRQFISKRLGGNKKVGCYLLAATIFLLGMVRDTLYKNALKYQPRLPLLGYGEFKVLSIILFVMGQVLVVSSTYKLGITGTFLGDYFGILMDEKVESFPFNVTNNPMYHGSTLSFLAAAIWYQSPAGLLLTVIVHIVYKVALQYEEPFTTEIYARREAQRNGQIEPRKDI